MNSLKVFKIVFTLLLACIHIQNKLYHFHHLSPPQSFPLHLMWNFVILIKKSYSLSCFERIDLQSADWRQHYKLPQIHDNIHGYPSKLKGAPEVFISDFGSPLYWQYFHQVLLFKSLWQLSYWSLNLPIGNTMSQGKGCSQDHNSKIRSYFSTIF